MLHSLGRRAICVLLILACSIQVQSEPIHRRPFHQERDSYDDRTVAAAFHALSFKFWNSVSERSVDIKHDLGVPPQNDPRYQLIKRQGGSGAVTNSTPSVTPTTPPPSSSPETTSDASTPPPSSETPSTEIPDTSSPPETSPSPTTPTRTTASPTSETESTKSSETPDQTTTKPPEETTSAPPISSTVIGTTTNEDGGLVTYTSVVLVQPTRSNSNGNSPEPSQSNPSLQNGASAPATMKKEMLALLGAIGVAFAL
ncbi:hypothetical protein D8B26_005082 [Coccidioides posadasii str. Silveira]|uniref:Uncharacterized protein n=2 Tax=Coccidioides posadasii TaxID=199306 RepID=E9D5R3_COCPS|nr:hypothetical protein CPC735_059530 [Coccidioides posadasii C735 delta SOWgp]EER24583.1 hypothetical protein CPC735_059530 [Coccidioides posadasii C735 delta SOWgp]EFW18257.1 conserved hypothetical protein [Coccidioides posadasii str. Silveira]QVM10422.1 hypothetical protein D8B26_005082 [Coccidioides posadasii str. Silveira]|eukprot:XP_003066728.1 hypothetical protein CPC735_059530 [Coccidioides posadasii C735 delta SOWgp]